MAKIALLPLLFGDTALAGCAGGSALETIGLRKPPELADALKPARNVSIRLHAAGKLNVDAQGRPLALVARIYKLRQEAAFHQAPYDAFLSPQKEKDAFGADLVDVKEVMLVPGQRYEILEKVSREAYFVGDRVRGEAALPCSLSIKTRNISRKLDPEAITINPLAR